MDRLLRSAQANRASDDHPADPIALEDGAFIDIVAAERIDGYRLAISFSDGQRRLVDFEPFLRNSRHPQVREYLQPDRFAEFRVEDGDLIWDDYGLCFPLADLYENRI